MARATGGAAASFAVTGFAVTGLMATGFSSTGFLPTDLTLNPAMKILTQRRKGAKIRRFATVLTAVILHPAGDKYFTGLLFVTPFLCAFAPLRENSYFRS